MSKYVRMLTLACLVTGLLVAGFGGVSAQDDQPVFRIVSHGGIGNPFWVVVIKGMEEECARIGADCEWLSHPVDNIDDMAGFCDDALAANPDGLGITVPNPEVIRDCVNRAAEAGIPVIVLNTADPNAGTMDALPTMFYIGANEFTGGVSNANRVLAAAAADGVEITGAVCPIQEVGHSGLEARCTGVSSVLEEAGIPIERLTINNDVQASAGVLCDYLSANPSVNAVFLLGPNPASSFNLCMQESGRMPGEIYATTHDTGSEIYEMIKDGYLLQAIDQQPYLQGSETIHWLYMNMLAGMAPGGDILTGPGIIDNDNIAAVEEATAEGRR